MLATGLVKVGNGRVMEVEVTSPTNIKLLPHTPRQIGSERRQQGQSRCHGPVDTMPSHRSSPPSFPSPSTPTHSAHTCGRQKRKEKKRVRQVNVYSTSSSIMRMTMTDSIKCEKLSLQEFLHYLGFFLCWLPLSAPHLSNTRTEGRSYSVCMLALVSSKAHSTDSGLREVTLLHSICRFSLEWKTSGQSQQH